MITTEFAQEIGLTEQQVTKVTEKISELEESWKSVANTNAEKIIEGAIDPIKKLTGIEREKGQKAAEYLKLASENFFKGKQSALELREKELSDKLKSAPDSAALASELETVKGKLETLKEKEARFADWEENDYKGKWEESTKKLTSIQVEFEFDKVKPQKPENVNQYEFDYKWSEFKKSVLEKFNVNEGNAVDKENEFKKVKLSDLIKKDENMASLLKGVVQGIGSTKRVVKIADVPFDVPEGATPQERTKAIRDYLASKGIPVISNEYATQFEELNKKILAQKTA